MNKVREEDIKRYGKNVAPQLPWSVQINPTYGCNRAPLEKKHYIDENGEIACKGACDFCGIYSLIDHDKDSIEFRYMTVETAEAVAKQLNDWVPGRRIEFNNFGEPWLNPDIFKIIKAFRDNYPSSCLQLQTNGVMTYKNPEKFKYYVTQFFENGGNLLVIDGYQESHDPYIELSKKYVETHSDVKFIDYSYDNKENISYFANHGSSAKMLFVVDDLGELHKAGSARMINNHAGNVDKRVYKKYNIDSKLPLEKKCSRVFREIIVGYDGTVSVCCQDFRRQLILGVIPEDNVRDIWNSNAFNTVRKLMYDKNRTTLRPCYECSYAGGFRLGFLTRPEGEVTDEDYKELVDLQKKYSSHIHFNGYSEINGVRIDSTMKKLNEL